MTVRNAAFSSASIRSAGTSTSSKNIEPRPTAADPTSSYPLTATPGASRGTTKAEIPRERDPGSPVRANTIASAAWVANEIDAFSPFRTYPELVRAARSLRFAASDPPPGSVRPSARSIRPSHTRGTISRATSGRACAATMEPLREARSCT